MAGAPSSVLAISSVPVLKGYAATHALGAYVIWCFIGLVIFGSLCAAAGIGGGGIIVSVLMNFGELSPHDAVPLSKAIVFFGSVCSLVLNLGKSLSGKSPSREGPSAEPLINWHIAKVIVPMALVGTLLGVMLNRQTPGWGILLMLVVVLVFMTATVSYKAWQQYKEETQPPPDTNMAQSSSEVDERRESHGNVQDAMEAPLPDTETQVSSTPSSPVHRPAKSPQSTAKGDTAKETQAKIASEHARQLGPEDAFLMGAMFLFVVFGGVLRHRAEVCAAEMLGPLGPAREADSYCRHSLLTLVFGNNVGAWMAKDGTAWVVRLLVIVVPTSACLTIGIHYALVLIKQYSWSVIDVVLYMFVAVSAGCLAGLVGIGGGLIFSPFFLLIGVEPSVAVATSATCVLFTSSSTTCQYFLTGRIDVLLACIYGVANVIASYFGTSFVHHVQDKFMRRSYVSFIIVAAVASSAILSIVKLGEVLKHPELSAD
eukprot:gnl/MRDRNA2_/MRDRNA2_99429_c0_seq1.p1 gnl/MRDRNA2_/MRDRNA2_99429_c0~~gnl/MRDRNA2_/MRDRNA2_99429_c0_seq1.p1  ORF type:complete len:485 (+),score=82.66 gnl/MRDRNA2_/MRDRNA2_99429_c0_seq1:85-1539(+)